MQSLKWFGIPVGFLIISVYFFYQGLTPKATQQIKLQGTHPEVLGQVATSSGGINSDEVSAKVTRVIDGDTFEVDLNGQKVKVRYIGIDTPETVDPHRPVGCFGKEASDENKNLIEGKTLELTKDVTDKDKFGRLLRFAYLKLDNGSLLFINDFLVREGFAKLDTIAPNLKFADRFLEAQGEAKLNKRGLWQKCQ